MVPLHRLTFATQRYAGISPTLKNLRIVEEANAPLSNPNLSNLPLSYIQHLPLAAFPPSGAPVAVPPPVSGFERRKQEMFNRVMVECPATQLYRLFGKKLVFVAQLSTNDDIFKSISGIFGNLYDRMICDSPPVPHVYMCMSGHLCCGYCLYFSAKMLNGKLYYLCPFCKATYFMHATQIDAALDSMLFLCLSRNGSCHFMLKSHKYWAHADACSGDEPREEPFVVPLDQRVDVMLTELVLFVRYLIELDHLYLIPPRICAIFGITPPPAASIPSRVARRFKPLYEFLTKEDRRNRVNQAEDQDGAGQARDQDSNSRLNDFVAEQELRNLAVQNQARQDQSHLDRGSQDHEDDRQEPPPQRPTFKGFEYPAVALRGRSNLQHHFQRFRYRDNDRRTFSHQHGEYQALQS